MNPASVNGSTMVSKTTRRGSNPWRGAIPLFLAFCLTCNFAEAKTKTKKKKVNYSDTSSVLVFNETKSTYEYGKQINLTRPIASVTKLMTAMVALEYDKNLKRELKIDSNVGGTLPRNRSYTRHELFSAMLVRSDNSAAETLSRDYPGGRKAFIDRMNTMAFELKMPNTKFDDPTGLSANNVSTAIDISTLVSNAAQHILIRETSIKKQIEIESYFKKKVRKLVLNNTNKPVLFEFNEIVVSKTGFTSRAGYCLALSVEKNGQTYSVVILGAKDKFDRIKKVEDVMYNHIGETYELQNIDN